jgi:hypothetical protein
LIVKRLRRIETLVDTILEAKDASNLGLELHRAGQALQDAIRGLIKPPGGRTSPGENESSKRKLRRKRGRPATSDPKADQQLAEGYRSTGCRHIADYALMIQRPYQEVKRAIDRDRQRMRRKARAGTK